MSASSKKKLRKEQNAAQMTERQLAEQKEAKKLKLYTIAFVAVLVALLVIAVTVGISKTIESSGIREKNTVAMTIGEHEISNAELNYFYIGAINNFYSQNASYMGLFGLESGVPLNEQMYNETTGETWADYFLSAAKENAHATYTLADAAKAAGHTLSEEETASLEASAANISAYASLSGYPDSETYLKAMYGNGATIDGLREYMEISTLADSYYAAYANGLTVDADEIAAADAENAQKYDSYSYRYYYLSASRFLEGGTEKEDGTTEYTDDETAASVEAAEEAAKALVAAGTSAEALDAAIAGLSINAGSTASAVVCEDYQYASVPSTLAPWVTDASRKAGDITYVSSETTSTDADGNQTTTIGGYYVVMFEGSTDNNIALKNIRHILVNYEGGTTDSSTGMTTYSDEEKKAAKDAAEDLLEQWKSGDATEDSFAALATEHTDDPGSAETGGLYEDVFPGQMVANFNDWCFDESRKVGDTGLVESDYGYHVMYFAGDSELTYRNYLITNDLKSQALSQWYTDSLAAVEVVDGDFSYLSMDMMLN